MFCVSRLAVAVGLLAWAPWAGAHEEAVSLGAVAVVSQEPQRLPRHNLPARKTGLWEVLVRTEGTTLQTLGGQAQRPQLVRQCTDAEVEPIMLMAIVPGQENCHEVRVLPRSVSGAQGGFEIHTQCAVHGSPVVTEMELQGDLQSSYSGSFSVKYPRNPAQNPPRMGFEGRWLGLCQPGQKPGDMMLPIGVTVNVASQVLRAEMHDHDHEGHGH